MRKIGFIGTGTMGSAIIRSVIKNMVLRPEDIMIYDIDSVKMDSVSSDTGTCPSRDYADICAFSDILFICLKPDKFDTVLPEIKPYIKKDTVVVSIAAGVSIACIKSLLGSDIHVIRVMPNTPLIVGEGMTVLCPDEITSREDLDFVISLFGSAGKVEVMGEDLMTEVISLTGSSPAYVFMLIDAMASGAEKQGIDYKTAVRLASQAVLGSVKMMLETGSDPIKLKNDVCSPGGTTIEAMKVFEEKGFREIVIEAMEACTKKAYMIGRKRKASDEKSLDLH